jgi:8-oxo-dGTP pyrophosphatase MutT (NUDIX family)
MSRDPAPARPAATVLLLRDGAPALEVFMVRRHHEIDFATGALVFPGGKIDADDRAAAYGDRLIGAAGLNDEEIAFRIAAIREAFEESAVLIAAADGDGAPLAGARVAAIRARHHASLIDGTTRFAAIAAIEDLWLDCARLVPFARWITPVQLPKRYDTMFFLCPAPDDQIARHDGAESVASRWVSPAAALADAAAGRVTMLFATRSNLARLGRSARVAEALAAARRETMPVVQPKLEAEAESYRISIPADAGYEKFEEIKAGRVPR